MIINKKERAEWIEGRKDDEWCSVCVCTQTTPRYSSAVIMDHQVTSDELSSEVTSDGPIEECHHCHSDISSLHSSFSSLSSHFLSLSVCSDMQTVCYCSLLYEFDCSSSFFIRTCRLLSIASNHHLHRNAPHHVHLFSAAECTYCMTWSYWWRLSRRRLIGCDMSCGLKP